MAMSDPQDRTTPGGDGGDTGVPVPSGSESPPVEATPPAEPVVAPEDAVEAYDAGLAEAEAGAAAEEPAAVAGADYEDDALDDDALYDDYDEDEDEFLDAAVSGDRWGGVLSTLGAGLVGVVSLQVLGALVEGLSLDSGERISQGGQAVTDDVFHRLGYTFFNLAPPALLLLLIGIVLLALPPVLGLVRSAGQATIAALALRAAIVAGVILGLGGMLAVRANLHEYAAKEIPVPTWVRLNFTNFLLGTLGAAALAVFGAVSTILRDRR